MSALDRAFIRVFSQQGISHEPAPAASSCMPLAAALMERPKSDGASGPICVSADEVRRAMRQVPAESCRGEAAAGSTEEAGTCEATPCEPCFQPMLQVERFLWPGVCDRLETAAADQLDRLAGSLMAAGKQGQRVLALAGCQRGEGATTLLLCGARRLARQGQKVVMVDADLAQPQLPRRLGLKPEYGWEAVLCGRLPVEEVVIESLDDHLALMPLGTLPGEASEEDQARLAAGLDRLAAAYDLVLVDLGPLSDLDAGSSAIIGRLDAIALVCHRRNTDGAQLDEVQRCLDTAGIVQIGIIENFVAV